MDDALRDLTNTHKPIQQNIIRLLIEQILNKVCRLNDFYYDYYSHCFLCFYCDVGVKYSLLIPSPVRSFSSYI